MNYSRNVTILGGEEKRNRSKHSYVEKEESQKLKKPKAM
jgi:hypothetical protein